MTEVAKAKAIERDGVLAALKAIRAEAHRLEKADGYAFASVRSLAVELGHEKLLPVILRACVEGGFSYCLDHEIECKSGVSEERGYVFPSADVCFWGADQLRSRLDCVDWRLRR